MLNQPHDVHVVVRSANERTTSVATQLACAQLQSDHDISVIAEVPFEAALRATYAIGLAVGKKWTMALDADILLAPNAIVELTRAAELMPPHYVQVQGRIWDKILGMYRQAGPRIYRTGVVAARSRIRSRGGLRNPSGILRASANGQAGAPIASRQSGRGPARFRAALSGSVSKIICARQEASGPGAPHCPAMLLQSGWRPGFSRNTEGTMGWSDVSRVGFDRQHAIS